MGFDGYNPWSKAPAWLSPQSAALREAARERIRTQDPELARRLQDEIDKPRMRGEHIKRARRIPASK